MQLIESVEIKYLRSIHRLRLRTVGDLTVFSGANDVGKSNMLKALNLFFNNQVDWHEAVDFYRDFSLRRLDEVRRESIKGRQFISISVQFQRPPNYQRSLPPTFRVTKTWLRDSIIPQESNDLDRAEHLGHLPRSPATARRMLSQFMNRVRFEYVPAVKDRDYYTYILQSLQETLLASQMDPNDPILDAVRNLNSSMRKRAGTLREDFQGSTGIEADVSLPVDPTALFQVFTVNTRWQPERDSSLPLTLRGDGIQARYVPSLLSYISANSNLFHIWGFEEPENSIEYNLAIELASEFEQHYTHSAQVFVTTHSPAFFSLNGSNTVCYRVYKADNTTELAQLHPFIHDRVQFQLIEDIGLFRIQEDIYRQYLERRDELESTQSEVERLREEIAVAEMPVVYLEGKTDQEILNTAWEKLYGQQPLPFLFKNCDPLPENSAGGAGGTATLAKLLSTIRADSPRLVVGVFDRDKEGIDTFSKLPSYLAEDSALDAKVSENAKCASFLLPIPPGKEGYAQYFNLEIEFYFGETALLQPTPEGRGLEFRQPNIEARLKRQGNPLVRTEESTDPETREIVDGKSVFALQIVPTLDEAEFEPFRLIFDKIQVILTHLVDLNRP